MAILGGDMLEEIKEKYLSKLIEIQNKYDDDTECRHGYEDDLLCELLKELGYEEIVNQYNKTGKWYA